MSTSQKRVLITGANKGVGLATVAAVLEARDDTYVLLGSRSEQRGQAAMAGLVAENPEWEQRLEVLSLDVADQASVTRAAETVASRFGRSPAPLYGLINNAGIGLGSSDLATVLEVNTRGPYRVCEAFIPLIEKHGRIVNVASASGPMFVAACAPERQAVLTNPLVTWGDIEALMAEALAIEASGADFASAGLGNGNAYGLSKALLNAYTIALARRHRNLTINACTPGYIETDLTRPMAEARGAKPEALGMKPPAEGTRASLHLLLGEVGGSGWYFGSDAERSPLDRYRAPGDPPYDGS